MGSHVDRTTTVTTINFVFNLCAESTRYFPSDEDDRDYSSYLLFLVSHIRLKTQASTVPHFHRNEENERIRAEEEAKEERLS